MKEEKIFRHSSQDDIPDDFVIHRIVKDYKRMRSIYETIRPRLEEQRRRIIELKRLLVQRSVEAMADEEAKQLIDNLVKSLDNKRGVINTLQEKLVYVNAEKDNAVRSYTLLNAKYQKLRIEYNILAGKGGSEEENT